MTIPTPCDQSISLPEPDANLPAHSRAVHWHNVAQQYGQITVEAARRSGEALAEERDRLKAEGIGWKDWCRENLPFSYETAARYIRIHDNWDELVARATPRSIREAIESLSTPREKPLTFAMYRDAFLNGPPGRFEELREGHKLPIPEDPTEDELINCAKRLTDLEKWYTRLMTELVGQDFQQLLDEGKQNEFSRRLIASVREIRAKAAA